MMAIRHSYLRLDCYVRLSRSRWRSILRSRSTDLSGLPELSEDRLDHEFKDRVLFKYERSRRLPTASGKRSNLRGGRA